MILRKVPFRLEATKNVYASGFIFMKSLKPHQGCFRWNCEPIIPWPARGNKRQTNGTQTKASDQDQWFEAEQSLVTAPPGVNPFVSQFGELNFLTPLGDLT